MATLEFRMGLPRAVKFIPVARLLLAGEVLLMAQRHVAQLEPHERRRVIQLVRLGHGRRRNLSPSEQEELADLIAKAEPRLFVGHVAQRFSPVPLPKRVVQGPRAKRRDRP